MEFNSFYEYWSSCLKVVTMDAEVRADRKESSDMVVGVDRETKGVERILKGVHVIKPRFSLI